MRAHGRPRLSGIARRAVGVVPDGHACIDYLEWLRWPEGFRCPRCVNGPTSERAIELDLWRMIRKRFRADDQSDLFAEASQAGSDHSAHAPGPQNYMSHVDSDVRAAVGIVARQFVFLSGRAYSY